MNKESPSSATIVAVATGPAAGGVGIVRLSGPLALRAAKSVIEKPVDSPAPRTAVMAAFTDANGAVVDYGLCIYFPAPHSYTGEDVVELHAHGAPRLLALLVSRLATVPGVRLAEAGEFTRRAYMNGRIDLARAEAVADLVAADSLLGLQAAAAQLNGALSRRVESVRAALLALHTDLEAALNFPEEADDAEGDVATRINGVLAPVRELAASVQQGALARRGAKVVLFGPVNAGKSTLFNAWAGDERALVDAEPGTTRDALEAQLEWDGLKVTLVDTAGLRDSPGRLEQRGIERTQAALAQADAVVLLVPPGSHDEELARWRSQVTGKPLLEVRSKADLANAPGLAVSALTGVGVESLKQRVRELLTLGVAAAVTVSSLRHQEALGRALTALERALTASRSSTLEVVAGEVGLASAALGEVVGADVSTELLDAIFEKFCIGK
ncbi:MAG: tRNA uridine-5-carboxymethylaminomethyl(34) synthesis GTPase MnmE [Myxococcaceae bacterium]|nr:tRNA uridine-5-carboxymethylaminomethyl(34) synthesis GTPase MnmE [Myxococcaceae bacterium]